ncbi:MAG: DUF4114 domain-containing protein [Cyanobacteria bacterium P01_H01_bin.21]
MAVLERINLRDDITDPNFTADNRLVFRATFTDDVNNVTADDFNVTGVTGATIVSAVSVNQGIKQYDITIEVDNLPAFTGTIGLELADDQDITDADDDSPVPTAAPTGTNASYQLTGTDPADTTPPEITSIERQTPDAAVTDADALTFRVTFSEDVQNVNAADFVVNGDTTATVTSVTEVNDGVYDVVVSGGDLADFNGDVGLDLAGDQDIADLADNDLPDGEPDIDEVYTVDNDDDPAPSLISIERLTPGTATTSSNTLVFQVTFDESVQNVDANDFSINGNSTATITNVTAVSDSVYNITVSGGDLASFNGSVGLDLAGTQNITDLDDTALPNEEPDIDETYTVSNNNGPGGSNSELTVVGNILEITELGSAQSLNLTINTSSNVTIETVKIFSTDADGNNRTQIGSFSVIEGSVLPVEYTPGFSFGGDDLETGTFLQFEIEEIDLKTNTTVVRTATLTSISETEVSIDFGNGTELVTALADEAAVTNLLLNDAAVIDLTGLTGQSEMTFTVYREAKNDNTVGFYVTDFADGRIIIDELTGATISPGEAGYKEAALAKQLNVQLTGENNEVTIFNATIDNGVFLSTYVVVDGVDPSVGEVFFSHQGAGSFDQIRQVGANAFGVEDIIGGGDQDFNDMVIEFEARTVVV